MGYNPFKPHMSFKGDVIVDTPKTTTTTNNNINYINNNNTGKIYSPTSNSPTINTSEKALISDNILSSNELIALESAIDDALAMLLSLGNIIDVINFSDVIKLR